jgi:hypothetical protein
MLRERINLCEKMLLCDRKPKPSGYHEINLPFKRTDPTTYFPKTSNFAQQRWNVQQQSITTLLNRCDSSVQPYIPITTRLFIAAPEIQCGTKGEKRKH